MRQVRDSIYGLLPGSVAHHRHDAIYGLLPGSVAHHRHDVLLEEGDVFYVLRNDWYETPFVLILYRGAKYLIYDDHLIDHTYEI